MIYPFELILGIRKMKSWNVALASLITMVALAACKKAAPTGEVFASASVEIKAGWNSADAAMKTNGYAAAILQLQALRANPALTPQQQQVVDAKSTAISDKMYAEANKDDPAAKQALQDLKTALGR